MAGSPSTPSRRSIFAASFIGTSIEWYDYYIFGTAAALVFGTLFFPQFSSVAGTLAAFGTFAVGFIARPLGAAVIGHYGDRIGRKAMLVLTLLLTGGATASSACCRRTRRSASPPPCCSCSCVCCRASASAGSGAARSSSPPSTRPPGGARSTAASRSSVCRSAC